jgi:hypothetical protein
VARGPQVDAAPGHVEGEVRPGEEAQEEEHEVVGAASGAGRGGLHGQPLSRERASVDPAGSPRISAGGAGGLRHVAAKCGGQKKSTRPRVVVLDGVATVAIVLFTGAENPGERTETMSTIKFTQAAQENIEETRCDVDADLAALRSGAHTRESLLSHCLDGADADREQGWREYVEALGAAV